MADKYEPRLKKRLCRAHSQGDAGRVCLRERDADPALDKIVINMGVGEATADSKKPAPRLKTLQQSPARSL
jgi:large subunit ribosomal protein L5